VAGGQFSDEALDFADEEDVVAGGQWPVR